MLDGARVARNGARLIGDVRGVVATLAALGPLPTETEAFTAAPDLDRWEELMGRVSQPLTDEEAYLLAACFPSDDSDAFGAAWTLVHLLESAPGWPAASALERAPRYWREVLLTRLRNSESP